jgi:hypothetical protein
VEPPVESAWERGLRHAKEVQHPLSSHKLNVLLFCICYVSAPTDFVFDTFLINMFSERFPCYIWLEKPLYTNQCVCVTTLWWFQSVDYDSLVDFPCTCFPILLGVEESHHTQRAGARL